MADELVVPEPVGDADRVAAIARLHDLVSGGGLSLERFSGALEQVLAARSHEDLAAAMMATPALVRLTPASRRLGEPLKVDVRMGNFDLGAGWQLASETSVSTFSGKGKLDLTEASWDDKTIDLQLETVHGRIEVLVPAGIAVQMRSAKGRVSLDSLAPSVPGAPVLRVVAAATTGQIVIRHPDPQVRRQRSWLGRRRSRE